MISFNQASRVVLSSAVASTSTTSSFVHSPNLSTTTTTTTDSAPYLGGEQQGRASTSIAGLKQLPEKWLLYHDSLYDMTEFADVHPGGYELIEEYLEKDVSSLMEDPSIHKHSKVALSMMSQYLIGRASDYLPNYKPSTITSTTSQQTKNELPDLADYQQPLCHQVGLMGTKYFDWVHDTAPVYFKDSVLLFANPFMESLSHNPWYVVPTIWIPFILYLLYVSSQIHSKIGPIILGYSAGVLCWFALEIIFHKFLFHWDSLGKYGNYWTNIAHFLLHGFHHKVPMDGDRLVVPPALMVVLASPIYLAARVIIPSYCYILVAGAFTGYLFYDMHHYWLHHQTNCQLSVFNPISYYVNSEYWKTLKSHHFIHHFEEGGDYVNYGISNRVIDMLLGTLKESYAK